MATWGGTGWLSRCVRQRRCAARCTSCYLLLTTCYLLLYSLWLCLLQVRGALHVAIDDDAPLVPGMRCGAGLRIDEMLLDAVGASQLDGSAEPFVPPPRQQMRAAVHALRPNP